MKSYFKNELKRALFGKNALISFFITLGILISSFVNYIGYDVDLIKRIFENPNFDAIDIFLNTMSGSIVIVFPLLATIIFSDSYLIEKESGFIKFIYTRISIKKYVFIKILVNSISSMLIGIISSFLMLILSVIIFGVKLPNDASFTNNINGPFSYLLNSSNSRLIYGLIIVLLFGIGYMVTATLALGISAWIKNRYLVLISPFFYYIVCGTVIERLGINRIFDFHLSRVISLRFSITKPIHVFIYPLLLFIIGVALFYIGVIIKNEKDL